MIMMTTLMVTMMTNELCQTGHGNRINRSHTGSGNLNMAYLKMCGDL